MNKFFISFLLFICFFVGCKSSTLSIEVAQPWENHYYTIEQFKEGTKNIQLQDGESIWVISNRTLSRVLKNYMQNNLGK